ncbi:hypothetical protein EV368DRAFT_81751 [Lentinula lateritia]|nr:hypothetical protein EV368DRAFT_81751 [Lentinula lateritia]
MATTSLPLSNVDRGSALLIAQLALDDIRELRGGNTYPDQEYALEVMAEEFAQVLSFFNDAQPAEDPNEERYPTSDAASSSSSSYSHDESHEASSSSLSTFPPNSTASELVYSCQDSPGHLTEPIPECVACTESLDEETPLFVQPCGHHYCGSCLTHYIETCISNDNLFPPKCCGSTMSFITEKKDHSSSMENPVQPFEKLEIGPDLGNRFNAKALELYVRPEDRVYCPSPRCSAFLGSWGSLKQSYNVPDTLNQSSSNLSPPPSHQCPSCFEQFCVLCKDPAHSETLTCPIIEEHFAEDKLRDLARSNEWQTCPGCKALYAGVGRNSAITVDLCGHRSVFAVAETQILGNIAHWILSPGSDQIILFLSLKLQRFHACIDIEALLLSPLKNLASLFESLLLCTTVELESADCLASLVSSQLTLDEIRDITFARKGKAPEDNPITDEEIAFKLFEEENAAVVGSLQLAFSLQHAIDVDQAILAKLSVEELGAVDDHRYAQALSLGQVLPDKSDAQKALEDSADSEATDIEDQIGDRSGSSGRPSSPHFGGSKPFQ